MAKRSLWMSKVMVFILALAVVFTYSVMPVNQAYAAAKAKKPAKVTGVKAEAVSSSSVKVTWKKAKNAKKYQIYVSTNAKKNFKRAATVKASARSYTVKKYNKKALKANKKYYFKVRAINGKKKGKFSKTVSAKTKQKENIVEKDPNVGEAKSRTMTIEVDMTDETRYPKGHKVEVWVPVPSSESYQVVSNYDLKADGVVASEFTVEKNSGWSNQMAHFVWDENAEPADRKATAKFDVERKAVSRPDPKEDASATIPADAEKFISLESSAIDLDNAYVQKYAKIAAGDATTTLGKAENIYNWVIDNLERFDIGDKFTGKDGKEVEFFNATGCGEGNPGNLLERFEKYGRWGGHCTDLNSCFVALCRANGIAAREMFGIRLNDTSSDGQHCWAEFYLPGEGWTFADPGDVLKQARSVAADRSKEAIEAARKDQSVLDKKKALWCGVDNNRIVLSRGRDLVLEPAQKGDVRNTFGYPYAEVDGVQKDAAGKDIDCTKYKDFKYTITCSEIQPEQPEEVAQTITAEALMAELKAGSIKLVDLRRAADYSAGHIVTAVSADMGPYVDDNDKNTAAANLAKVIEKDDLASQRYALLCYSGNKFANAGRELLLEAGAKNDNILILAQDDGTQGTNGGMKAWSAKYPASFLGITKDAVTAEDFLVDVRDAGSEPAVEGAYSAPVKADDKVAANLDAAFEAAQGKRIVIVCYTGNAMAKKALLYYADKGVDMSKITYLIGGATNF